jgi:hypothetical protein
MQPMGTHYGCSGPLAMAIEAWILLIVVRIGCASPRLQPLGAKYNQDENRSPVDLSHWEISVR